MPTFETRDERLLIGAVLEFANLADIHSTAQVHQLFTRLPSTLVVDAQKFKELPPEETHVFIEGRDVLRGQLERIVKNSSGRPKVGSEIDADLQRTVRTQFKFTRGRLKQFYLLDGVEACVSMAVALILDEGRNLTSRLQQCGAPYCKKFLLDFETSWRPRKHCNDEHRKDAGIETRRKKRGG
jgi:hypothetical protein